MADGYIRETVSLVEVAAMLNISRSRLYRAIKAMRAAGFPRPLPGLNGRYDPAAIAAWQNSFLPAPSADPGDADPEAAAIAVAQAAMNRRADQMAAAHR